MIEVKDINSEDKLEAISTERKGKAHTILYVDDESHNLRVFRSSFRRYYNIIIHDNPTDAIDTIRQGGIDILVTDQRMPGMTGTQMIEAIRSEFPDLISIIITGYSDIDAVTDAINKCGIHRYITKPYETHDLKSTLDNAIKMDSLKKEKENLMDQIKDHNEELEVKIGLRTKELTDANTRLVDSLNYAKIIQNTILPNTGELEDVFTESLVFYKPLNIVSGDFYFIRNLKDKVIIGSFDCTGHGVPGAMLSMLGNAAIDSALLDDIINPSELMTSINNRVFNQLKISGERGRDGMDGSFILYDRNTNKILFTGAKGEIVLFRNNQLERIRGNRRSVGDGFLDADERFDQLEIDADGVSEIYLYSDGFRDQVNNDYTKKYQTNRFHALLESMHEKEFSEQESILEKEFLDWKGDADQTDDIMVLGFRM